MSKLGRFGVDASYAWPTGSELHAAGVTAVMDYITDPGPGNKGCTQERYDDRAQFGIAQGFVWELGAQAVLGGFQQGVADATRAQHNLNQLKGPSNKRPLYFAIDFDIQPGQYGAAVAYFQGVNKVLGVARTGAYGHWRILDHLTSVKVIQKRWQTYAWSGGAVYGELDVLQYSNGHQMGSGTVDYCHFNSSSNWGQKGVLLSKPAPKPKNQPAPQPDPKVWHAVTSGETLTSIAGEFNTTLARLLQLSPELQSNPDFITVGEKIRVK